MSPLKPPDPAEREQVVERLRKMVRRWPAKRGYRLNPYPEVVEGIVQALTRSTMAHGYPYCPCREVTGDRDVDKPNTCPCAHHAGEIERDGHCRCVLFIGEDFDVDEAYRPDAASGDGGAIRSVNSREVTVYSTPWCFMSRRARALLTNHGVEHTVVDIEDKPEAARQVEAWNGGDRSVPVIQAEMILTEPYPRDLESILATKGLVVEGLEVYVTQWCGQSRRLMNWLAQNGVEHSLHDIDSDISAARRVMQWNNGNRSVPTVDLRIRVTEPLSAELEQALGLRVG